LVRVFVHIDLQHHGVQLVRFQKELKFGLVWRMVDHVHQGNHSEVVGHVVMAETPRAQVHPGPIPLGHYCRVRQSWDLGPLG
jgi:hypothetical protein